MTLIVWELMFPSLSSTVTTTVVVPVASLGALIRIAPCELS